MIGQPPSCQSPFQQKRLPYQWIVLQRLPPAHSTTIPRPAEPNLAQLSKEMSHSCPGNTFPGFLSVMEKLLLGELRYGWYSRMVVLLL
jgi:hypothetical protein